MDETGRAVAGARIEAAGLFTLSGPDGSFTLSGLPTNDGDLFLSVSAVVHGETLQGALPQGVLPLPGGVVSVGDVVLTSGIPGTTVVGRTVDEMGAPVAGVAVKVYNSFTVLDATSGRDGRFSVPGAPGQGTLSVSANLQTVQTADTRWRGAASVAAQSGGISDVGEITLLPVDAVPDPLTAVVGAVSTTSGSPVAGARVSVLTSFDIYQTLSSADGTFSLQGVPTVDGDFLVTASAAVDGILATATLTACRRSLAGHPMRERWSSRRGAPVASSRSCPSSWPGRRSPGGPGSTGGSRTSFSGPDRLHSMAMASGKNHQEKEKAQFVRELASNRRARHDYHILESFEAGLRLSGTEVKAARTGKVQLKDSFVEVRNGEAWLIGVHISPYSHGNRENHLPERDRKLLLKKRQIDRLFGRTQLKGQTVVPLSVYPRGTGSRWRSPWRRARSSTTSGRRQGTGARPRGPGGGQDREVEPAAPPLRATLSDPLPPAPAAGVLDLFERRLAAVAGDDAVVVVVGDRGDRGDVRSRSRASRLRPNTECAKKMSLPTRENEPQDIWWLSSSRPSRRSSSSSTSWTQ